MAKQKAQEPQEEPQVPADSGARKRGYDALTPADRFSVDQTHPHGDYGPRINRGAGVTAEDVAAPEEREGSVLPYKVDDIDVDSLDTRTDAEIAEAKQAEAESDSDDVQAKKADAAGTDATAEQTRKADAAAAARSRKA